MYRFLVRTIILLLSMTTFLALTNTSRAQENTPKILAPIGGGYEFALQDLLTIVHSKNPVETINILVLPIAYATNPNQITAEERNANQKDAEMRRGQIEQMCRDRISTGVTCNVTLAEIYIHSDAEDSQVLNLFNESLTMIFILGGQQDIAMQLLQGTVLENELAKAYQKGVIIAGTSAGAALQSRTMIAGFTPGFNEKNAMQFGALEIWNNTELRGLAFGIQDAIIDQHFFQYGRMGRLLNAISMPDQPHLGIGIDAETGAIIQDGDMLSEVFGKYTLAILDAETYHAADRVIYRSTKNIIGMKNILYHMLSPSSYTYDIHNRQHSLAAPLPQINRQFRSLSLPVGAGPLILGGDLESSIGGHPALNRFVNLSGGLQAKILILVGGFKNDLDMQQLASSYGIAMGIPYQTFYLDSEFTISATISNFSGMLVIGKDPEVLKPLLKNIIAPAWRSGIPLMLDKEVSATVGKKYTTSIANMKNPELAAQMELIKDKTPIVSGIGLVNFNVEPLLNSDNRWGRLTALAYSNPDTLAIGIPEASAIIIAQDGITIDGYDALILLDFRNARVDLGNNEGFVFANALIDIYAPGDSISSQIADSEFVPVPPATPVIPSPTLIPNSPTPTMTPTNTPTATTTPTPTVTIGPKGPPTKTLKPTNTPPAIPPPADPNRENIMILLVFLLAIVVFVGVWINRRVLR